MSKKTFGLTIPYESGFTHVLFNLLAQGVVKIEISYSGSGDSGAIDEIQLLLADGSAHNPDTKLAEIIDTHVCKNLLDDLDDWYNDDGGGGKLVIETADAAYKCDHYVNIVSQEFSEHEGKFGDN